MIPQNQCVYFPFATWKIRNDEWYRLSVENGISGDLMVKINGITGNKLLATPTVSGHTVIWLPSSRTLIRHVIVVSGGLESPLNFADLD